MTAKSRGKRNSNAPRPELARQRATHASSSPAAPKKAAGGLPPLPDWDWRTFPVYFAFSVGGFAGLYLGLLSYWSGNDWFQLIVFVTFAMLLGWGLSRIMVRWTLSRKWGRLKAKPEES